MFMLILILIQISSTVKAERWFCTETWSNGAGTWTRDNHCYGTQSNCTNTCIIGPGCTRSCTPAVQ